MSSSNNASNEVKITVPIFDGSNYNIWVEQMSLWLRSANLWRIVNGTTPRPTLGAGNPPVTQQMVDIWDDKDEAAFGAISLRIAHHMRAAVLTATNVTSAMVWTAITTTWSKTGISAIYQDYKAAIRIRVGTSNPAKDITRLQTHFERLAANNAPVSAYEQGIILLSAIPDEWDHVAAYYVQTCPAVANVSFDAIRKAVLAEFDRSGGSRTDQTHVADKITAIKRKGKPPHFSKQKGANNSPPANADGGPSSSKRRRDRANRGKKPQGDSHHHTHFASTVEVSGPAARPMIALQPSRAGPSTTTIASFKPQGISYESKPLKQSAQTYTGHTGKLGPASASLKETRTLISRLDLSPTIETMKSVEALRKHRKFVEKLTPYKNALAGEKPSFPPLPTKNRIEEIPEPMAHMPPTGSRPKKTTIMKVGLPIGKNDKGKEKEVTPPIVTNDEDEPLDWGTDDERLYNALADDDIDPFQMQKRPLTPSAFLDSDDDMGEPQGNSPYYDHITPQVPFLTFGFIGSLIIESQGQFCNGLDNTSTAVCIHNLEINTSLSANCTKCKKCASDPMSVAKNLVRKQVLNKDEIEFIGDSGASATFTYDLSDFSEYKELDESLEARTANKGVPLKIKGSGTVFLRHQVDILGNVVTVRLSPVYYIPGLSTRLLSIGEWLQQGCTLRGTKHKLAIMQGSQISLSLYPRKPRSTIYILTAKLVKQTAELASMSTIFAVDYDLMHRRMGHPSKDVLRQATRHTENFPPEVQFPGGNSQSSDHPVCRGCAEGKMHLQPFGDSVSRASSKFELIHSDLKELPTISYHKYKYFVTFLDDFSSYCWVVLLKQKSDTLRAIDDFLALVRTQHSALVKTFMTDAGGEYKSFNLLNKFKELGITTRTSVPHMHQQNGRAERLNRMLIEKAQALRFEACLPQSYWEFSVEFAVHVYNRTPIKRIAWRTPYEALNGTKPDISHLRVFGCGAYVFIPEDV